MTTQARILANRLNAQKSTGPKTTQGKAAVSQNALKHGLSAHRDVITTESQEEFDRHRDSLLAKSFGLKALALPQSEPSDSDPDLILGRIALKDFSNERVLDRLLMYERRIEHSLFKTLLELQRLRLLRNLEPENRRLAPGLVPGVSTEQGKTPNRQQDNIQHHYAKQTQFPKTKNRRNRLCRKDLHEYPAPPPARKQTQSNPISPRAGTQCETPNPTANMQNNKP